MRHWRQIPSQELQAIVNKYDSDREDAEIEGLRDAARKKEELRRTDLERTQEFLDIIGVPYTIEDDVRGGSTLIIAAKSSLKVTGYSNFVVDFQFSVKGEFKKLGIWE